MLNRSTKRLLLMTIALLVSTSAAIARENKKPFTGKIYRKDCLKAKFTKNQVEINDRILGEKAIGACKSMLKNSIDSEDSFDKMIKGKLNETDEFIKQLKKSKISLKKSIDDSKKRKGKYLKALKAFEKSD